MRGTCSTKPLPPGQPSSCTARNLQAGRRAEVETGPGQHSPAAVRMHRRRRQLEHCHSREARVRPAGKPGLVVADAHRRHGAPLRAVPAGAQLQPGACGPLQAVELPGARLVAEDEVGLAVGWVLAVPGGQGGRGDKGLQGRAGSRRPLLSCSAAGRGLCCARRPRSPQHTACRRTERGALIQPALSVRGLSGSTIGQAHEPRGGGGGGEGGGGEGGGLRAGNVKV